jgi:hypothetical protein
LYCNLCLSSLSAAARGAAYLLTHRSWMSRPIPTLPELRLLPLVGKFVAMLAEFPVFSDVFGPV